MAEAGVAGGLQVNRAALAAKLQTLNTTQQSIETLSKYCLVFIKDAKSVVLVWEDEFFRANHEKRLCLLYLANHVLQEGRKAGKAFVDEFYRVLPKATSALMRQPDEKMRKSVRRIVGLWEERRVFSPAHMKAFKDSRSPPGASNGVASPTAAPAHPGHGGAAAAPASGSGGGGAVAAAPQAVTGSLGAALTAAQQSQQRSATLAAGCSAAVQASCDQQRKGKLG